MLCFDTVFVVKMGAVCCNSQINSKSQQLLENENDTKDNDDKSKDNDDELILLSDNDNNDNNDMSDSDDTLSDIDGIDDNDNNDIEMSKNLLTLQTSKSFNESQTDILQRELKKEITKRSYDLDKMTTLQLQDMDSDDDDDDDDDNDNNDDLTEKNERRPSNLFRVRSRNIWDSKSLDEQELALKEQMMLLQSSQSIDIDEET